MSLISENQIILDYSVQNKEELIDLFADVLDQAGKINDRDGFKADVYEREELANTAMGNEIAIPHALSGQVKDSSLVFIRLKDRIEWAEQDEVRYIFGIAVPRENPNNQHLKILSQLARKLMDDNFKNKLFSSTTKADCMKILGEIAA